jgi:hypothetical protein
MRKYRIVEKLDNKGVFYYIVQQRKYLFFWGLPNWQESSFHASLIDDGDGLYAPTDYTYKKFRFEDLAGIIEVIERKKLQKKYAQVIEYL